LKKEAEEEEEKEDDDKGPPKVPAGQAEGRGVPSGQKWPIGQGPEQEGETRPGVAPNVPAGHACFTPLVQKKPGSHNACAVRVYSELMAWRR
jgi:hypothetical protein